MLGFVSIFCEIRLNVYFQFLLCTSEGYTFKNQYLTELLEQTSLKTGGFLESGKKY